MRLTFFSFPEKPVWPIAKRMAFSFLVALASATSGCTSDDSANVFEDTPVVTGYLIPGSMATVKIERKKPFSNEAQFSSEQTDSLEVTLLVDGIPFRLAPVGDGVYADTAHLVPLQGGSLYHLEFPFNGKAISAETAILSKPANFTQSVTVLEVEAFGSGGMGSGSLPSFPDPVTLKWTNDDLSYYLLVVENMETNPSAINDDQELGDRPGVFRNEPTQGNEYEINAMTFEYYGRHRLILYHINPDYAALYNDNGSSSQNLTSPVSNVVNGLGIFTGIHADTLFLRVVKP